MKKYWNNKINDFFLKLLKLDRNALFFFEWVFFDGKNIELRCFHKYSFSSHSIYLISNDKKNAIFSYNWNSEELTAIVDRVNKKQEKKSFNSLYLVVLKNLTDKENIWLNYFTSLFIWKNNYSELSFLLWNIHVWFSNKSYNNLMAFNFLEDYLSRRNERDWVEIKASICSIEHSEAECTYCNAQWLLSWKINYFYNLGNNFKIDNSYFKPRKKYFKDHYTTFINQNETIVWWATDKIEEILENVDYKKYDYIHINLCCLPTIIWDDLKSIIKRFEDKIPIPIIHTDQTAFNPYKILKRLLEQNKVDIKKEKDTCYFVWFPHQRWLFELKDILSTFWIDVKWVILPIIEIESLKELELAEKIVLIDTWRSEEAIKVFEETNKNTFRTVSPFWFNNSILFIKQILKKFNKDISDNEIFKAKINEFNNLAKNNNYEIWFMLLPNNLKDFLWNFRWLKIIDILSEMWFKLNIFYYMDENSLYKQDIIKLLEKKINKKNMWELILSTNKSDLDDFIINKNIDLYYSEIKDDSRILKYKKQVFSTSILEVWLDGAIRWLNKLLKLAKISRTINSDFR